MTKKSVWWIRSVAMILGLSGFMVSCTGVHTSRLPELDKGSAVQHGVASWYGREFHGRPTASGEPFDMSELTAAHPRAPFGTYAQVTNLTNGKSVQVRINDRGPFKAGRIIDLSYAAARQLGMERTGIARVRVELFDASYSPAAPTTLVASTAPSSPPSSAAPASVAPPPSIAPPQAVTTSTAKSSRLFTVQAGAYRKQNNALRAQQALTSLHSQVTLHPQPRTLGEGSLYRVHLGQFASRAEAELFAHLVKKRGYSAAVIALPSGQSARGM